MNRRFHFIGCLLLFSLPFITKVGAAKRYSFERPLMGTKFSIVCYAENNEVAEKAVEKAFSKAEEINRIASDYLPKSELSRLASRPINTPIQLSPILFDLLDNAHRIAMATGGAYDPTIGPLTKLWRETRASGRLPHSDKLAAARAASSWKHFTLDTKFHTITLLHNGMAFDLGGIAKGYAADLMLETLAEAGISQALITAGGDIRLGDPPPGREGWNVALKTFDTEKHDEILTLSNAAVSTSGDLHQSVEIEGVSYAHILDPATGFGMTSRVAASVIATQAKLSDALATAVCVCDADDVDSIRKLPGVREVKVHQPQEPQPDESKTSP
jgi:FAD:protein FMN transferase